MKKILSLLFISIFCSTVAFAQDNNVMGPAEKKITDSLCGCISKIDMSKVKNNKDAKDAFVDCFGKQADLLLDFAQERKVSMDDDVATNKLGEDIGKDLLKVKCPGFAQLAMKMAEKDQDEEVSTTDGRFKRIDDKGFNYIVITDNNNQEKSFLWLKQFTGSENFTNGTTGLAGKKLHIEWQEIEVYIPQARGYYKVKEIKAITIL